MQFFKYQGAGNDFVIVDNMNLEILNKSVVAAHICDRHFGVGADGFIAAEPSAVADVKMALYNADGSEAGMCGNGIRCFAKFVSDLNIVNKSSINIETGDGSRRVEILEHSMRKSRVLVEMGVLGQMKEIDGVAPSLARRREFNLPDDTVFDTVFVTMDVPHAVIFSPVQGAGIKFLDELALKYGAAYEKNMAFGLDGANIDFVSVIDSTHILCSTWERGVGKTLACGTGACASAAVSKKLKGCSSSVTVTMPGGEVTVSFEESREGDKVYMEGNAVLTFVGSAPKI